MITTSDRVAELGTVLGIWAHPDDEAYLSGGLMALARDNGQRVVCVTATRGERGTADPGTWPPDRLAEERTDELAHCLGILGVREHRFLNYRDGECAAADSVLAIARLAEIVDEVRPDTVLTFGPDGITGHSDHRTVSGWVDAAVELAAPPHTRLLHAAVPVRHAREWAGLDAELGVYEPGYPLAVEQDRLSVDLALPPAVAARKVRALAAQATQTAGLIEALGRERYTAWVRDECYLEAERSPLVPG
jgi:LmbE family N-acetylglucosaminyl deacetylase